MHRVEALFDPAARFLHRRIVSVGRNPDGIADDDRAAIERQPETGAIPGFEIDAP